MKASGYVLAAVATLVATAASGKTELTLRQVQEQACYSDAMKLCREFVPNEDKITACMAEKKAELSPPCAALFTDK